jgi:hypothetical protein
MASLYRRGSIWYYENVKWYKKTWRIALLIAIGIAKEIGTLFYRDTLPCET